ncbi:AFR612Wp [Eremothecium gossypii ATCC 10895]|uniref:AFR612Wp n=1 Tax=Eremothecium gossypii (strain ATCC 10895 / CBS 109.51 / FGSC 9923 / NRRL Y-1056) TaxID=284811 RepID=Q752G4_EREGS|nr:AFR612Wp [Eremothecium gossypii ATCC 10895]AAS53983.1 AFR612Wp [Eremothecium gossypii ATCC 10895]AEY98297.1 FAFR612Wp [Eremothecium gossypii FDAG1]
MSAAEELYFEEATQRLRSFWSDESLDDTNATQLLQNLAEDAVKDCKVWLDILLATAENTIIELLELTCTEDFDHPLGVLHYIALRAHKKFSHLEPLLSEHCGAVLHVESLLYPIRSWWYIRKVPHLAERVFREQAYPKFVLDTLLSLHANAWPEGVPIPPSIPSGLQGRKAIKHIMDEACRKIISHVGHPRYLTCARKATLFLSMVLQNAMTNQYGREMVLDIESEVLLDRKIWERQLLVYMTDDFTDYEQHFLLASSVLTQEEMERGWLAKYTDACNMIAVANRTDVIPAFLRFTVTYAVRSIDVARHFRSYQGSQPRFLLNLVNYSVSTFDRFHLTIKDGVDLDTFLVLTALQTKFVDSFLERFLLKEVIMSDGTFRRLSEREIDHSPRSRSTKDLQIIDWTKKNDRFLQFKKDVEMSKAIGNFDLGGINVAPRVFNKSLFQMYYCATDNQRMMKLPDYLDHHLSKVIDEIYKETADDRSVVLQPHLHRLVIKADFATDVYLDIDIWQAAVLLEIFSVDHQANFDTMVEALKVKNITAFQSVLNSLRKHKILRKSGQQYILNNDFSPKHPSTEASPYRVSYSKDKIINKGPEFRAPNTDQKWTTQAN